MMLLPMITHNALGWCGGQAHIKAVVEAEIFVGLLATISHIFQQQTSKYAWKTTWKYQQANDGGGCK